MIRRLLHATWIWPFTALVMLLLLNLAVNPAFFNIVVKNGHFYGSLVDIGSRSAPLVLTALGMTLVIATGGVDLSVGAIAAVAASVAAVCLQGTESLAPMSLAAAFGISMSVAVVIGLWNGFLVKALGLQPIVATLIAMVAGRGIAQLLVDGQIVSVDHPGFAVLGAGFLGPLPFSIALSAAAAVLAALFCRRTAAGLFVEALGSSPAASRLTGLPTTLVILMVYGLSGLCAGVAGLVISSNIRAVDVNNLGVFLELDAILAVVIGGTRLAGGRFSLFGSVLGALIIQTVSTSIHTQGVPVEIMLVVKAIVVILICLLQSDPVRDRVTRFRTTPTRAAA